MNPVLDLLGKAETEVSSGNLTAAVATMGGFRALWAKASPVIRPLAGDQWSRIDSAAENVLSTFDPTASPDAETASSAISGLMGPLRALISR